MTMTQHGHKRCSWASEAAAKGAKAFESKSLSLWMHFSPDIYLYIYIERIRLVISILFMLKHILTYVKHITTWFSCRLSQFKGFKEGYIIHPIYTSSPCLIPNMWRSKAPELEKLRAVHPRNPRSERRPFPGLTLSTLQVWKASTKMNIGGNAACVTGQWCWMTFLMFLIRLHLFHLIL